jgi:hypothetical protein
MFASMIEPPLNTNSTASSLTCAPGSDDYDDVDDDDDEVASNYD